jgi:hypothetical protein
MPFCPSLESNSVSLLQTLYITDNYIELDLLDHVAKMGNQLTLQPGPAAKLSCSALQSQ